MTKQDYINKYWNDAVAACANSHIFPELAIAESAHESAWGESWLTKEANNFFGLKSTKSWETAGGKYILKPTREVIHGHAVIVTAKFRKYDTPQQCFENYVHFVTQPNYVNHNVINASTPEEQIKDITAAGYATDPEYAELVTAIIEDIKPLLQAA